MEATEIDRREVDSRLCRRGTHHWDEERVPYFDSISLGLSLRTSCRRTRKPQALVLLLLR